MDFTAMRLGHNLAVDLRRNALRVGLTLLVAGCDRADRAPDATIVRDSAGVTIVENRSNNAETPDWVVSESPTLDVGSAEGNGADVFGVVRQVVRLRNGSVAVLDASAREIRVFDQDGSHRFTIGRGGEGPGEFQNVRLVAQVLGDSIAAVDNMLGRVSVFSGDGKFARSYPIPRVAGGSAPNILGFFDSGVMVVATQATAAAAPRSTVLLYTVDTDGKILHQLGAYPDRENGSNGMGLGFGSAATFGIGASTIWSAHTSEFEVRVADSLGTVVRIIRLNRLPQSVTDAEVAEAKASVEAQLRRQGMTGPAVARILATEFSKKHPVMAKMLVDDAEHLWVSRYTNTMVAEQLVSDQREIWDVFEPSGGLRARVTLPTGFRMDAVAGDLLLGVHTDDSGLQRVRAYRVIRQ